MYHLIHGKLVETQLYPVHLTVTNEGGTRTMTALVEAYSKEEAHRHALRQYPGWSIRELEHTPLRPLIPRRNRRAF